MWFEAISGLRINLEKSELILVGCVENVEDLAAKLGCKVGSLPSSYLGLLLGVTFKSVAAWDGVYERFQKRLAMWKRQYISKGGRITLIWSTLASFPIYYMFVLYLPRTVRLRLEQIQRDFLWGGGALNRKTHLVRWTTIYLEDNKKEGLGVKCLSILNKALLCKWSWRFVIERGAFWNQVIRGKDGEEQGGWCTKEVRNGHGVGWWKAIRKEWYLVSSRLSFMVGIGRRVRFWKDNWCGTLPFCVSFPSLFALAVSKDAWVDDVWSSADGGGSWSPLFSRPFNDWEVDEVDRFLLSLNGKSVSGMRRIGCFGRRLSVGSFLLNPHTKP